MNNNNLLRKNIHKLEQMRKFEYDWNGNGGEPFPDSLIDYFISVITELNLQPKIAPTGRASLYLEYRNQESVIGIELLQNKANIAKIDNCAGSAWNIQGDISQQINQIISSLF